MDLNIDLPHHSYTIRIQSGSLARVGTWLSELWQVRKVVVITDHQVEALYAKNLVSCLEEQGFEVAVFSFLQGEAQKSLETVSQAYDFLANFGMTRQDGILSLGGGVVGDLAGFVASTYMRGLPFVQVPTSLMAQVDASVGGKTAVNTDFAKNIVGSFHQPDGVLIDPEILKTLGKRELIEGMAEVMKVAMIADSELWSLLERLSGDVLSILRNAEAFIYRACRVKADLVMADERDCGVRQFLNFGHTFGHALEKIAGYGQFMHGEAVAVGMVLISRQAEARGLTETGLTERLIAMCQKFGLPTTCPDSLAHQLYQAVALDKKARGKDIKLVIVPEIGQVRLLPVPLSEIKAFLEY